MQEPQLSGKRVCMHFRERHTVATAAIEILKTATQTPVRPPTATAEMTMRAREPMLCDSDSSPVSVAAWITTAAALFGCSGGKPARIFPGSAEHLMDEGRFGPKPMGSYG
eukprot:6179993-Pleurochrysis_carterae.AAC.1